MAYSSQCKKPIKSFVNLKVYKNLFDAAALVIKEIVFRLSINPPGENAHKLSNQLDRGCRNCCFLIADGFVKKNQKADFQKYINKAKAECNKMIACLKQVRDIYKIKIDLCNDLINIYKKSIKQLSNPKELWKK